MRFNFDFNDSKYLAEVFIEPKTESATVKISEKNRSTGVADTIGAYLLNTVPPDEMETEKMQRRIAQQAIERFAGGSPKNFHFNFDLTKHDEPMNLDLAG
ncbi:hypothetical protein [Rugamonas aquatica]|uniref:Uncharacterized protein n=1 Tax=Rugamonas aquatica TaxID=2743357 RepID=A0A6A7N0G1_9BURK|nr:hypothetical protein [Rugamonas aquatica]MQA38519.1 hypothetical protein [Rugamonas aquatica]